MKNRLFTISGRSVFFFFIMVFAWMNVPLFAQSNSTKPSRDITHTNGSTKSDRDYDMDEKKNSEIGMLWRAKTVDPDLTYHGIVHYCDSLFAIPGNIDTGEDGEYNNYVRWKFFWAARIDISTGKLHNFNKTAAQKLYNKLEQKATGPIGETNATDCQGQSTLQSSIQELAGGGPDGYGWGFVGPQNIQADGAHHFGQANQMVINPSNSSEMYVSDFMGGLWKTSNSGSTWICLTDNDKTISGIGVSHFDVDFNSSPHRLYVSLGYPGFFDGTYKWNYIWTQSRTFGLFFSDNDGAAWHSVTTGDPWIDFVSGQNDVINDIKVHPDFPSQYIFVATKNKLLRLDVSGLSIPGSTIPVITTIIDYSAYIPTPAIPFDTWDRSWGFGDIAFTFNPTPGLGYYSDMFVTHRGIIGYAHQSIAELYHVTDCVNPSYSVENITSYLNNSIFNIITPWGSGYPSQMVVSTRTIGTSTIPEWEYDNVNYNMLFYNDHTPGAGTGSLEVQVPGNYDDPAYKYTIQYKVQVPNNCMLQVFLRDPTNLYSADGMNPTGVGGSSDLPVASYGPTALTTISPITVTSTASSTGSDHFINRLIFRATSNSSYNPAVDGPVLIGNLSCSPVEWDFLSLGTTPANNKTIYVQATRLNGDNYLETSTFSSSPTWSHSWTTQAGTPNGIWTLSKTSGNIIYYGYPPLSYPPLNIEKLDISTNTLTHMGGLLHVDTRSIITNPVSGGEEDVYVGEDGGITRYNSTSNSWLDYTSGSYPATADQTTPKDNTGHIEVYNSSIAYSVASSIHSGDLVSGTADNSLLHCNVVNYTKWDHEGGGDCYYAAYGKRQATLNDLFWEVNGGVGPYDINCSSCSFYSPLSSNPQPFRRILSTTTGEYFAGNDVYTTGSNSDIFTLHVGGASTSWTNLTLGNSTWHGDGVSPGHPDNDILAFTVDPFDENYIAAFLDKDGIWPGTTGEYAYSLDGGGTWNYHPTPLFEAFISMAVNPRSSNSSKRVWIGGAGYSSVVGSPGVGVNRVFQTIDGGATWKDFSTGLPDGPVNALVFDEQSHYLFAGTDVGIYARLISDKQGHQNDGQWECYSMNLPNSFVTDLDINHCTGKLYVSSWGRGVFQADLPSLPNSYPSWTPLSEWDDPAMAPFTTIDLTSSATWNQNMDVMRSVIIEPGVTLTIDGTGTPGGIVINMARDKNITVKNGAQLIVRNATITNTCGSLWGCISVEGPGNGNPQDLSPAHTTGFVSLSNSTIANSYGGVFLGGQFYDGGDSPDYDFASSHNGGLLYADHTIFHNNATGVWIQPYDQIQNTSITYCTFEATDFLNSHHYTDFSAGPTTPRRFGAMRGIWVGYWYPTPGNVGGFTVDHCTFQTVPGTSAMTGGSFNPDPDLRGAGIIATNANFHLTNCTFNHLTRGIEQYNDAGSFYGSAPFIDGNNFTDCWRSATFLNVNYVAFQNNTITVGAPCTYPTTTTPFDLSPVGAYFSQAQGLWIYKNQISMAGPSSWPVKSYGIVLNNTNSPTYSVGTIAPYLFGVYSNTFYKNTIATDIGISAYQDNRGTQFQCNDLSGCGYRAFAVWGSTGILGLIDDQGTSTAPIGNELPNPSPSGCGSTYFDLISGPSAGYTGSYNYYEYSSAPFLASCIAPNPPYAFTTPPTVTTLSCPSFGVSCCPDLTALPAYYPYARQTHATNNLVTLAAYERSLDSMNNFIDLGNQSAVLNAIGNNNMSSAQLRDYLLSGVYLSNDVLIRAIDRTPVMDNNDLKKVLLKNSGLSKSVLYELSLKIPMLAGDQELLDAQSVVSGRDELITAMRDAQKQKIQVLKEITDAYVRNKDWKSAAQLYVSKQAWEIAMGFYLQDGDITNANLMARNIQDADERTVVLMYLNHYDNTAKKLNSSDSLSTEEKRTLTKLATNPYTHAGEMARIWLDQMMGKKFLEVMPVDGSGSGQTPTILQPTTSNPASPINIYPNPAQTIVTIAQKVGTWGTNSNISVYDINGKQISKFVPNSEAGTFEINISAWVPGVYMIVVQQSNGHETTERLVVETK